MNIQHVAWRLVFFTLKPAAWAVRKYRDSQEDRRIEIAAELELQRTKQELLEKYFSKWD